MPYLVDIPTTNEFEFYKKNLHGYISHI